MFLGPALGSGCLEPCARILRLHPGCRKEHYSWLVVSALDEAFALLLCLPSGPGSSTELEARDETVPELGVTPALRGTQGVSLAKSIISAPSCHLYIGTNNAIFPGGYED